MNLKFNSKDVVIVAIFEINLILLTIIYLLSK